MAATVYDALRALTPTAIFAVQGDTYAGIEWLSPEIPMPTEQEVNDAIAYLNSQEPFDDCKAQASKLLYETDWTTIPDVADPATSTPYLVNVQDYVVYRNALRQLAVYPVANPTWPTKPTSQWSAP
jgi:hypothetical protein